MSVRCGRLVRHELPMTTDMFGYPQNDWLENTLQAKLDANQREQANALIAQIVDDPEKYAFEVVALRTDSRLLDALLKLDIDVKPAEGGRWLLVDWRENPPRTTEHKTGRDAIAAALSSPNVADQPRGK